MDINTNHYILIVASQKIDCRYNYLVNNMDNLNYDENPFETMCKIASKEKWCWRIWCTTCGHMYFRYGFLELATGKHPKNDNWLSGQKHHNNLSEELGRMPILGNFSIKHQIALSSILKDTNIISISNSCKFPAWLGYLGMALVYSEKHEKKTRQITKSWIPQFLKILPTNSQSITLLKSILNDPSKVLSWQDLELIEGDLINEYMP